MKPEEFEIPSEVQSELQANDAKLVPPTQEELMANFSKLLQSGQERSLNRENPLPSLLQDCIQFLEKQPEPPATWSDRLGERARLYEYHQVVLPDGLCDPYAEEIQNLKQLLEIESKNSFMALEHYILTRNHFLMTDGHIPVYDCPEPLLMLESHPEDQEVDWDCLCYVFPDGSYQVYNLEKEEEESLGRGASDMFALHAETLSKLALKIPQEGEDYGDLRRCH